jgi:hypothetical protein
METLLPLILGLLPVAEKLVGTITQAIATAKSKGELTPEQETTFNNRLDNLTSQEHWRTDAQRGQ